MKNENETHKAESNQEALQEEAREKLLKKENQKNKEDKLKRHEQSMEDSQGESSFSGGSNNSPGNVDRGRRHSNMSQRNF